jgi:hypothetical protein
VISAAKLAQSYLTRLNWRNIAIALKTPEKGEQKAHACEIA